MTGLNTAPGAIAGGVSAILGLTHPGLAAEKDLITQMAAVAGQPALLYDLAKQLAEVPGASAQVIAGAEGLMTVPPPANPMQNIMFLQQQVAAGMG